MLRFCSFIGDRQELIGVHTFVAQFAIERFDEPVFHRPVGRDVDEVKQRSAAVDPLIEQVLTYSEPPPGSGSSDSIDRRRSRSETLCRCSTAHGPDWRPAEYAGVDWHACAAAADAAIACLPNDTIAILDIHRSALASANVAAGSPVR
jgi:hypothetical protein